MKTKIFLLFFAFSAFVNAQNKTIINPPSQASFYPVSFEKTECVTEAQRQEARVIIAANKQLILQKNPKAFQHRGGSPLFNSPIRAKAGFNDYGYYSINNQVDHNLTPNGHLLDYECGQRTYDWNTGNHEGTDYVLWPYPWKRMQEEIMEVVAAAPGIIIDKRDGFFDLNCINNGNPNWNGIIIEHSDGSQAWYWHFKDAAITTKSIGDTVAEGEYLGAAGSSGSSTIPHLHFEIYDSGGNLIDPYEGPCNSMNANSWWASQPEYNIPTINHISTHSTEAFDDDCGVVENTYEELNFNEGDDLIFRMFYRDIQDLSETDITFKKPDGTVLYEWTFQATWGADYPSAYVQWVFPVDGTWPQGVYTIEAVFAGNTYETIFGVGTTLGVDDLQKTKISVYPNPTKGHVYIESNSLLEQMEVYDLLGRRVIERKVDSEKIALNFRNLNSGVYLVVIHSEGKKTVRKIVKE